MYSLSVRQMNTLITVLLLYEWNDILCHFACVIDWERNRRGYILLSRWLGCAGPRWLVISPMPGGSGSIQRWRVQGAFAYSWEIKMEMRDNEGWDQMIVKEAAKHLKDTIGEKKDPKRTPNVTGYILNVGIEIVFSGFKKWTRQRTQYKYRQSSRHDHTDHTSEPVCFLPAEENSVTRRMSEDVGIPQCG